MRHEIFVFVLGIERYGFLLLGNFGRQVLHLFFRYPVLIRSKNHDDFSSSQQERTSYIGLQDFFVGCTWQ